MSDSLNTPSFLPPADLAKELSAPESGSPGDESIRPSRLEDFIGQEELRANLRVFLNAARERGQAMDHVLFYGNPGLGKTTLAQIMAAELGVNLICTSGPVLERSGDLAAILTNLSRHDILFVDEIHRIPIAVEEILYPALEDYKLDLLIGQGPAARTVKIDLEPFTLVGATTRIGLLSSPLRDRFGIISRLEFYTPEELSRVVMRSARILGVPIAGNAAYRQPVAAARARFRRRLWFRRGGRGTGGACAPAHGRGRERAGPDGPQIIARPCGHLRRRARGREDAGGGLFRRSPYD